MADVLAADVEQFVRAVGPELDDIQREMEDHAEAEGFPTVGPDVGGFLRLLAGLVGAERVFEFGSGFGYSAYWFAGALPPEGEIVLTEHDADELAMAREYLDRGGFGDLATYEEGDALAAVERHDGPFDAVLIDVRKDQYPDAFEAVREKVRPGGVVVADNAMTSSATQFDLLLSHVTGGADDGMNEHTRGTARYLDAVRSDPAFETVAVPLGEGLAVSHRRE